MQLEKNSRKGKQRNKCRKHIIGLKSENLKKEREEKKGNSTELQKSNIEAVVYNNKICDWGKKPQKLNLIS